MSESRPPVQAVAVSLPGLAQELVRQRLPLVFQVQSVERYPLPSGGVRNVASLFNEAAAIQVCRRAFKNTQLCALNDYSGTLAA